MASQRRKRVGIMAKGRLTQNEKYIIEGMSKDKHTPEDIAKELGRTQKTIERYQDKVSKSSKKKIKKQAKKSAEKAADVVLKAKDLMVRKTLAKQADGVSIMTEAASARGDEPADLEPSRTFRNAIYRPNTDE